MGFDRNKAIKLVLFNGALLALNVAVFSNLFFKVRLFGGSAVETAVGLAVVAMGVVAFFAVNLQILNGPVRKIAPRETADKITDLDSCRAALGRTGYSGTFAAKLQAIGDQVEDMQKKQALIGDILLQKFSPTEMSYQKFQSTVLSAQNVLCLNVRSILNRIYAFDEEEYGLLTRGKSRLKGDIAVQKLDIYKQYIDFVDQAVQDNDELLLRLDKLLLEISKFNTIDIGALEQMAAVKELDSLIADAKWYR